MSVKHLSLFTGAGGFDLAASKLGWDNVAQVEISKFAQGTLNKNFNESAKYYDIRTFNAKEYSNSIDVISGGFPCQPFSLSGNQKGTNDERFLWPEMYRVIREVQPIYVVAENVPGLIIQERGLVFEQICFQLESAGYETLPLIIPAYAKNANHERKRIWLIAYSANAHSKRIYETPVHGRTKPEFKKQTIKGFSTHEIIENYGYRAKCRNCRNIDGIPYTLDEHRLFLMGNAIVWQIAYELFKTIDLHLNQ
jgi:DNA (cytosine-5)-methyltransferase 1